VALTGLLPMLKQAKASIKPNKIGFLFLDRLLRLASRSKRAAARSSQPWVFKPVCSLIHRCLQIQSEQSHGPKKSPNCKEG